MKLKIFAVAIALAAAASVSRNARAAGDPISGEWDVTFRIEGMTTPATFKFALSGDRVSGTADSHHTGAGTVRDGSWKDGRLAMTLDFASHESIVVTGSLEGEQLTGEFRTEGRVGKWDARKKRPGEHVHASAAAASPHSAPPSPYAPYEQLIGEWDVAPEGGGPATAGAVFRWGPNHSYIWTAGTLVHDGVQEPHFEGMMMWNGVHRNLDALLVLDMRYGLAQEQGTYSIEPDGTIVREITAVFSEGVQPMGQEVAGPGGATSRFRQTFKSQGPDRFATAVLRQSGDGWVATFPGSDHLVMTRRSNS